MQHSFLQAMVHSLTGCFSAFCRLLTLLKQPGNKFAAAEQWAKGQTATGWA
jgi:hypothetical protein